MSDRAGPETWSVVAFLMVFAVYAIAAANGAYCKKSEAGVYYDRLYASKEKQRYERWIIVSCFLVYTGRYFCTVVLSAVLAKVVDETGISLSEMSAVITTGYCADIVGRIFWGVFADTAGGRSTLLIGIVGVVIPTAGLACTPNVDEGFVQPLHWVTVCWCLQALCNGSTQRSLVVLVAHWITKKRQGLTMSFLLSAISFGELAARVVFSLLLAHHVDWRELFMLAPLFTLILALPAALFLVSSPEEAGLPGIPDIGEVGLLDKSDKSLVDQFAAISRLFFFWCTMFLAFALTGMWQWCSFFLPNLFSSVICQGQSSDCTVDQSTLSHVQLLVAAFVAVCLVGRFVIGCMKDQSETNQRGPLLLWFLVPLVGSLLAIRHLLSPSHGHYLIAMIFVFGWCSVAPGSLTGGSFSLDIGGVALAGTVSGCIGSAQSFGSVMASFITYHSMPAVWETTWSLSSYSTVFTYFCALAVFAAFIALTIWRADARKVACPPTIPPLLFFRSQKKDVLMKVLSQAMWEELSPKETKWRCTLMDVVGPALFDIACSKYCACVAHDAECYTVFAPLLEGVAGIFHGVNPGPDFYRCEWPVGSELPNIDPSNDFVLSTQIRVSRNLEGFPLMGGITVEQRREVAGLLRVALTSLAGPYAGTFTELSHTTLAERKQLVEAKVLSASSPSDDRYWEAAKVFRDFPDARGIFRAKHEHFELVAWINEEDHLRLMLANPGAACGQLSDRMQEVLAHLERTGLRWAKNSQLGYLQTCPTNVGTGMCCGMHLRLPGVTTQPGLFDRITGMNLQCRGVYSKSVDIFDTADSVVDISNKGRAVSEKYLIESTLKGLGVLLAEEKAMAGRSTFQIDSLAKIHPT